MFRIVKMFIEQFVGHWKKFRFRNTDVSPFDNCHNYNNYEELAECGLSEFENEPSRYFS